MLISVLISAGCGSTTRQLQVPKDEIKTSTVAWETLSLSDAGVTLSVPTTWEWSSANGAWVIHPTPPEDDLFFLILRGELGEDLTARRDALFPMRASGASESSSPLKLSLLKPKGESKGEPKDKSKGEPKGESKGDSEDKLRDDSKDDFKEGRGALEGIGEVYYVAQSTSTQSASVLITAFLLLRERSSEALSVRAKLIKRALNSLEVK